MILRTVIPRTQFASARETFAGTDKCDPSRRSAVRCLAHVLSPPLTSLLSYSYVVRARARVFVCTSLVYIINIILVRVLVLVSRVSVMRVPVTWQKRCAVIATATSKVQLRWQERIVYRYIYSKHDIHDRPCGTPLGRRRQIRFVFGFSFTVVIIYTSHVIQDRIRFTMANDEHYDSTIKESNKCVW